MQAVAVRPGEAGSAALIDIDAPQPGAGECLVRVLEVGIDGTDREIDAGEYGEAPEGSEHLVLGHECAGVVERGCEESRLREGTLVVPTVRRPCPQRCPNCEAGAPDFCSTGDYLERGIKGAHGFMCELFTERPEHLVPVPDELRAMAVLLEPISILQRTYRQMFEIQQRLIWQPQRVFITGAGNMGVMAAFLARLHDLDALVYSRGDATGVLARFFDRLDCDYVNSEEESLAEVAGRVGAPDIVIEGTGFSPLAWDAAKVLALNGVACLLSVTQGDTKAKIASDKLNRRMVLGNRLIFGSVNAHREDFERGVETLRTIGERWPGLLEQFITHRRPFKAFAEGLREQASDELKTVLEGQT
jgi:glucose 1-dehydrogenase